MKIITVCLPVATVILCSSLYICVLSRGWHCIILFMVGWSTHAIEAASTAVILDWFFITLPWSCVFGNVMIKVAMSLDAAVWYTQKNVVHDWFIKTGRCWWFCLRILWRLQMCWISTDLLFQAVNRLILQIVARVGIKIFRNTYSLVCNYVIIVRNFLCRPNFI